MRYLFIGGPWDGEYRNVDTSRDYIDVKGPTPVRPFKTDMTDDELFYRGAYDPTRVVRYTLRRFETPEGSIWYFADITMSDLFVFEHLLYHYR
jgi:hypothetical protein